MKILVTGGTGYLGRRIVPDLMVEHDVRVLTRQDKEADYEVFIGDITCREDVERAVSGCEAVVHMAVLSDHSRPWEEHRQVTVQGTRNVLEAARGRHIVHLSSMASEASTRTNYVRAKALAEQIARDYPAVILKPSSIYDISRVELAAKASRLPLPRFETRFRPISQASVSECVSAALKSHPGTYQIGDRETVSLVDFIRASAFPREPIFLPACTGKIAKVLPRARFFLEDKVFETDMSSLGVKPRETLETVFRMRFGDSWREKFKSFSKRPGQESNLRPPG